MMYMSFEQPVLEPRDRLHKLLLTIEEEIEARKAEENERGARPFFETKYASGEKTLTVLGTRHTSSELEIEAIVRRFHNSGAGVVIHEGRSIQDLFPGMSEESIKKIPAVEVAKRQEQAFLAWTAFREGKDAISWDLPLAEQLILISKTRDVTIVMAWLIIEALNKIYASHVPPNRMAFEALLGVVLQPHDRTPLITAGFDFSSESIDGICRKHLRYSIDELVKRWSDEGLREEDWSRTRALADPAYSGETNEIIRELNVLRDRHAIDVIEGAKANYKNAFVLGGGSHVRTWTPALKELYRA